MNIDIFDVIKTENKLHVINEGSRHKMYVMNMFVHTDRGLVKIAMFSKDIKAFHFYLPVM
jgi:hypothetical protein